MLLLTNSNSLFQYSIGCLYLNSTYNFLWVSQVPSLPHMQISAFQINEVVYF